MKNLIEFILNRIVDHPADVAVEETEDDRGHLYTIHVHEDDMGRVIGRHGVVINAIRAIVKIRAIKENIRASVKLAEPESESETEA